MSMLARWMLKSRLKNGFLCLLRLTSRRLRGRFVNIVVTARDTAFTMLDILVKFSVSTAGSRTLSASRPEAACWHERSAA